MKKFLAGLACFCMLSAGMLCAQETRPYDELNRAYAGKVVEMWVYVSDDRSRPEYFDLAMDGAVFIEADSSRVKFRIGEAVYVLPLSQVAKVIGR